MGKTTDMPSILNPSIAFASHSQLLLHTVLMLMAFEEDEGFICRIYITAQRDSFLRISQLVRKSEYTDILLTFPLRLLLFEAPLLARKHDTGFFFFLFYEALSDTCVYIFTCWFSEMLVLVQGQNQHWFMTSVPYISDIARWTSTLAFSSRWQVCVSCCHMSMRVGIGIHMAHFLGHIQCCCIGHFVTELGVSFAFVHLGMHVKRSGKVCSISALHPPPRV